MSVAAKQAEKSCSDLRKQYASAQTKIVQLEQQLKDQDQKIAELNQEK